MCRDPREIGRSQHRSGYLETGSRKPDEVMEQDRDIRLPPAQRRQFQRQHVEAVIEIGTEFTPVRHRQQILIGRGDDPDIDLALRVGSQPDDTSVLQHPEQP